jgi:hypothetical protein
MLSVADGVGTVTIASDPDRAEIFIDDKFLGNAVAFLLFARQNRQNLRALP